MKIPLTLASVVTAITLFAGTSVQAELMHRYSFDDLTDSVGDADVTLHGSATISGGSLVLPGGATRTNYASINGIGATIGQADSLTVEAWFTLGQIQDWSKVWMFGTSDPLSYIDLTAAVGFDNRFPKLDFDSRLDGEANTTGVPNPAPLTTNQLYYVASVYNASTSLMSMYINGALVDSASMGGASVKERLGVTAENYIGAAVYWPDADLMGSVTELRIWDEALSSTHIAAQNTAGADTVIQSVPDAGSTAVLLGLSLGAFAFVRSRFPGLVRA